MLSNSTWCLATMERRCLIARTHQQHRQGRRQQEQHERHPSWVWKARTPHATAPGQGGQGGRGAWPGEGRKGGASGLGRRVSAIRRETDAQVWENTLLRLKEKDRGRRGRALRTGGSHLPRYTFYRTTTIRAVRWPSCVARRTR